MKNKKILILFYILFFKQISLAYDIPIEKIQIFSYNQVFDIESKKITFTEKVQLKYRNFIIKANKVVLLQKKNKKNFLEGYGNPIILKQIEKNQIITQISCTKIYFHITDKMLFLSGDVNFKQINGNIFSDNMTINLKNNIIQANSQNHKQIQTILTFK